MTTPTPGVRRMALAVNPSAGKGRARSLGVRTAELLAARGFDVLDVTSESAAEAADRATSAVEAGIDALVVVGGDGMVNIGVNACAGSDTPLGIVAAGTGNDIAASLGLPVHDIEASVEVITTGQVRRIDAVRRVDWSGEGPRWFAGVMCGGFDAVVNERANRWAWPRGKMRYNLAIARELPVFKPLDYVIELDGERWETQAMMVSVGNGTRYGGGMLITPDASYDDGLLDVLVVGPMSVPRLLTVFPKVFSGSHTTHPKVTVRRARHVRLQTHGIIAYADGERFGPLPIEVEVMPASLGVLVPAAAAGTPRADGPVAP
ncbi:MAG TPA: YegS/Rv2252/BmrU family lipid kinase [Angustibacter sp.]|nr:YegS/Rv2252/BmrU family lipid kinase [Angustibacter sp.]